MIKLNANNNKIIKDNVDFHNISNFRAKTKAYQEKWQIYQFSRPK